MQTRSITRIVDLRATQMRVVIWLKECPHKVSITQAQLASMPAGTLDAIREEGEIDCPFCPGEPKVTPPAPTARQLWKDAGEP